MEITRWTIEAGNWQKNCEVGETTDKAEKTSRWNGNLSGARLLAGFGLTVHDIFMNEAGVS